MRIAVSLGAVIALEFGTLPAQASMPMVGKVDCPIGDEKADLLSTGAYTTFGVRLDGKAYSDWISPTPIAECRRTALVLYKTFSAAEVRQLPAIINTVAYQRLRKETTYYRAAWISRRLDPKSKMVAPFLLGASWQADGDGERKARYLNEFIAAVDADVTPDTAAGLAMVLRAVNAERELSRFDAAERRLKSIPTSAMNVPVPEPKTHPAESGDGVVTENRAEIQEAQNRRSWIGYAKLQQVLLDRRDPSQEPDEALPGRIGAERCLKMTADAVAASSMCKRADVVRWLNLWKPSPAKIAAP